MLKKGSKIIFVYNADSGLFNNLSGSLHKAFSHRTYQCNLCKITYGPLNIKSDWKNFMRSLDYSVEFLHKEEFHKKYLKFKNKKLPAVFEKTNRSIREIISANEINKCKKLDDLKKLVSRKLKS